MRMKKFTIVGCILCISIFLIACKKKSKDNWTDTMTSGMINIACDESFKSLMDAEIQAFEAHFPNAFVKPIYTTETEAIRLLTDDSVRFAITTRELNRKENAKLTERQMNAKSHLIAFDGIALIMNRDNNDSIMGMPTLKKILTGEITEWSQIDVRSSYGTIRTVFDNKESGILRYAVDSILRGEPISPNIYALNKAEEVIEKVIEMPNAIGLVGVNVVSDETNSLYRKYKDRIRMIRISKEEDARLDNSYLPYAGDIVQENYPLWRPVLVLLSDPRSGLSAGLSVFLANEIGQKIVLQSGLLPVTDPQVRPVIVNSNNMK